MMQAAYHEAGHAVMAALFGAPMGGISITPTDGARGHVLVNWRPRHFRPILVLTMFVPDDEEAQRRFTDYHLGKAYVYMGLAGAAAEAILYHEARIDREEARRMIDALWTDKATRHRWRATLTRFSSQVRKVLTDRWTAVDALAQALVVHNELNAEQMTAIVKQALGEAAREGHDPASIDRPEPVGRDFGPPGGRAEAAGAGGERPR
jgi:hypothetical protein